MKAKLPTSPAKRANLQRVAEAAGVSISTVDRVVNKRGGVSPDLELRVINAANALQLDRVLYRSPLRMIRVAFVIGADTDEFFKKLHAAIAETSLVFRKINLQAQVLYVERNDTRGILARLRNIESGFDATVVCILATPEISRRLREVATRIPVITLCNDIPDSGRLAYFGIDEVRAGRLAGELMGRFAGVGERKLLFLFGFAYEKNQLDREHGFKAILSERFPNCQIVAARESRADVIRAGHIVLEELDRHPDLAGIYNASNGTGTICEALGRRKRRPIYITHEVTDRRLALLKEGMVDAILNQNLPGITFDSLRFISSHFSRTSPVMPVPVSQIEIILRETVASS